ncbi:MAG TPA: amidohydrolase family protein [bacterium]|nr:amidohydrolase family protein [bacterium]
MEIISARYALPMTNGCPVVEGGAIAVELGRIHAFGESAALKSKYPGAEVKEMGESVIMPGLVNAHCHLDLVTWFEGTPAFARPEAMATPSDFVETLLGTIDFKHDAKPDQVMDGIGRGVGRLVETGVTCVGDMTHFEGTFKVLREMGLRAVVFPEILAGRGEAAQQKFEVALALLEKYTDASHDRVRVGLGPFAPYLLSRNLLKIIAQHAKEASIPLMIHAAESFAEMEFFFDSQGQIATEIFPFLGWNELPPAQRKTPVEYLAEIGFFEAPTTIIGGLHLSARDFPTLARHLARVVWCPTTNRQMKHGSFPWAKLSEHGIPMGLGTDFWHTKPGFNMWVEMRTATEDAQPGPTSKEVLRLATVGGARVLGLDHLVGTLEEGKKADYIVVDAREIGGVDSLYDDLVAKTQPHHVRHVAVGGNILKSI